MPEVSATPQLAYVGTYTDPDPLRASPAPDAAPVMGMAGPAGSVGIYSASEVVREALRLMEERDQRKAEIRTSIAEGLESRRHGEMVDGEAVVDHLEAELDALEAHQA